MKKLFIAQPYDSGIDRLRGTVPQQQVALQIQDLFDTYIDGAFLEYLQSLPTTEPLTPNMPWWNNNVLNRSAVAVGFTFRRPGGVDSYIRPSSGTYLRA